jgi:glycosyltransferase involved in cell wall biosynthesis
MILGIDGRLANEPRPTGAGRYCREVIQALATLKLDMKLRVYLDQAPREDLFTEDVELRFLPERMLWTHRALARELRESPPDVFFTPVTQLPHKCPCPSLVSVLDLAVHSHPGHFPWQKRIPMRVKTDHAIRHGGHFIAISESTAAGLRSHYRLTPDQITVAHLGVGEEFLVPIAQENVSPDLPERYVLYVGQLQPRKNLLRLMDAFARFCEAYPESPHHLVLAGPDGWQHGPIHRAIAASPVAHRILHLGYVEESGLPALIAGADTLALVSLWEGFGLPVLEAMAAGTAVLASNCSSLPELVGDGGVLVDPDDVRAISDGLVRLLSDDELRSNCEDRGRLRAQQFHWASTASTIATAAEKLAKG